MSDYDWREDLGVLHELACLDPTAHERRARLAEFITDLISEVVELRTLAEFTDEGEPLWAWHDWYSGDYPPYERSAWVCHYCGEDQQGTELPITPDRERHTGTCVRGSYVRRWLAKKIQE